MAVTDIPIGNLDNESDLLDWLCTELITNHRFVDRRNTGTVGSNDKERWIERPASELFDSSVPLLIGMRKQAGGAGTNGGTLAITQSFQTWNTASNTGAFAWGVITGTPTNGSTQWASSIDRADSTVIGGAYQRARLVTNPTSNSATPSEECYFYVVLEATAEVYRTFGFGEMVKLVTCLGGVFHGGSEWNLGTELDATNNGLFAVGKLATEAGSNNEGGYPGGVWSSDWPSGATSLAGGNQWHAMGGGQAYGMTALDPRGNLGHIMMRSPSPFSLQSQRWPATFFCSLGANVDTHVSYDGHAPAFQMPDVYIADISSFTAYGVFQDSLLDKYMVVPFYKKSGSGVNSSEHMGILIRNPDLVVTI